VTGEDWMVWSRALSMLLSTNGESVSELSPCSWANISNIFVGQCFSTFLLPQNPEQAWRSLTEPHALICASNDVCEVEATGCLRTHFPGQLRNPWQMLAEPRLKNTVVGSQK